YHPKVAHNRLDTYHRIKAQVDSPTQLTNNNRQMTKIAIIDYQMGNLRSAQKGFEKVGYAAEITSDPRTLAAADKIVLPGVGAFGDAIGELRKRDLVEPIREAIAAGKPFLGICLG